MVTQGENATETAVIELRIVVRERKIAVSAKNIAASVQRVEIPAAILEMSVRTDPNAKREPRTPMQIVMAYQW